MTEMFGALKRTNEVECRASKEPAACVSGWQRPSGAFARRPVWVDPVAACFYRCVANAHGIRRIERMHIWSEFVQSPIYTVILVGGYMHSANPGGRIIQVKMGINMGNLSNVHSSCKAESKWKIRIMAQLCCCWSVNCQQVQGITVSCHRFIPWLKNRRELRNYDKNARQKIPPSTLGN